MAERISLTALAVMISMIALFVGLFVALFVAMGDELRRMDERRESVVAEIRVRLRALEAVKHKHGADNARPLYPPSWRGR